MSNSFSQQSPRPAMGISRRRLHSAAWPALASMLLIFLGPLYSNTQALLGAQSIHHSPAPGFGSHAPGAHSGEHTAVAKHTKTTPAPIPVDHAECGYCVLLTHTASLTPTVLAIAPLSPWTVRQSKPIQESIYSYRPYTLAQGRAPPLPHRLIHSNWNHNSDGPLPSPSAITRVRWAVFQKHWLVRLDR